jgi:cell division septum initiation protein DivIVA
MTGKSSASPAPRTAEQIEADLARTREELTQTIDALTDRLDPRKQATHAAESVKAAASTATEHLADDVTEQAKHLAETATEQAKHLAETATGRAKHFADDVGDRKPTALVALGIGAAAVVGAIAVLVGRRR